MRRFVLGLGLCLSLMAGAVANAAEELKLVTSSWPPYSDSKLPEKGLSVQLVTAALTRAGYEPKVSFESWPRTLEGVEIGVFDVIVAAWYNEERTQKFVFSRPYLQNRVRLLKRKDSDFKGDTLADLTGLRVGVVRDFAYGDAFDKAANFQKVYHNHVIQSLLKLVAKQVDLVIGDELTLTHEIREYMPHEEARLEFLPRAIELKGLHIAVSKKRPDHAKIVAGFDDAIKLMKADGSYQAILEKHIKPLTDVAK